MIQFSDDHMFLSITYTHLNWKLNMHIISYIKLIYGTVILHNFISDTPRALVLKVLISITLSSSDLYTFFTFVITQKEHRLKSWIQTWNFKKKKLISSPEYLEIRKQRKEKCTYHHYTCNKIWIETNFIFLIILSSYCFVKASRQINTEISISTNKWKNAYQITWAPNFCELLF